MYNRYNVDLKRPELRGNTECLGQEGQPAGVGEYHRLQNAVGQLSPPQESVRYCQAAVRLVDTDAVDIS